MERDQRRQPSLSIEIPAPAEGRNSLASPIYRNGSRRGSSHRRLSSRRSTWFGKAFDSIGNKGGIDKALFIKATRDIEVSKKKYVELLR